jgi:HEAT repeat protein
MVCFCTGLAALAGIALEDAATVIFLLLALDKLIERVVARSFYEQSSNILFQPLEAGLRLSARTKEETMVSQLAVIPAGATLLFFNWIGSLTLVINVLVVILVGWLFTAILMAREYKTSLLQHLKGQSEREKAVTYNENLSIDMLAAQLDDLQPDKVIQALKLLERIDPVSIGSLMVALLEHPAPVVRTAVLQSIGRLRKVSCLEAITRRGNAEKDPSVQDTAKQTTEMLNEARETLATPDRIATLSGSDLAADRLLAAQLLGGEGVVADVHLLLPLLLQDGDLEVRRCALAAVGRTDSPELWQVAMEHLSVPAFCNAAVAALAAVGEKLLPALDAFFARPSQLPATMVRIVRIYGLIGGDQALALLIDKINFPEKRVRDQVIISLQSCSYQAKGGEFIAIKQRIEESIGNAAWSMAALMDVKEDENVTLLKSALASEIDGYRKQGFILLSLIYEPQSIQLVQDSFTSGSGGSKVYALELLDVFMDEDLKNILFPIFEDMSVAERLQLLEAEFPQQGLETVERLQSAINGEYTKVDRWTKACALYVLAEVAGKRILDELIAALFHPDHMLRETAAWCLHRLDPAAYAAHLSRLPDEIQRELDELIRPVVAGQQNGSHTRITVENVLFLKETRLLSGVPERILAELVALLDEVEIQPEETLTANEDIEDKLYILIEGQLRCADSEGSTVHLDVGEIIGGLVVSEIGVRRGPIIATKSSRLFSVDRDVFCCFVADHAETVSSIVNTASRLVLPDEMESQSING